MRIAYWDCFSGIAGDMSLGAMVGCGLRVDDLRADLAGLALEGFSIRHRKVRRGALAADKIDVVIEGDADPAAHDHDHDHPPHDREHQDDRHDRGDEAHGHRHHDGAGGAGHDHPQRGLADIRAILAASDLPEGVTARADRVFEALCAAEAAVHGCSIDEVHLHEAGAIDAIVDVVGACCGLRRLGVEAIRCSPLNVGGGTVRSAHGVLPVPAPATAHLLRNAPVYSQGPRAELVTPTGAALVAALAEGFGPWPAMRVVAVGYGAGDRDNEALPNVLRLVIGEVEKGRGAPSAAEGGGGAPSAAEGRGAAAVTECGGEFSAAKPSAQTASTAAARPVSVIETDLDDTNPQLIGALIPRLLEAGALDAHSSPLFMKKNRPGIRLTVIADARHVDYLAEIVLRETTTLGLRIYPVERRELERRHVRVTTAWGPVRVKVGTLGDQVVNWAPEFDDCDELARSAGVPVKHVIQAAAAAYRGARDPEEKAE